MTGENPDDYSLWLLQRGNLRAARNGLSAGISDDGLTRVSLQAAVSCDLPWSPASCLA